MATVPSPLAPSVRSTANRVPSVRSTANQASRVLTAALVVLILAAVAALAIALPVSRPVRASHAVRVAHTR